MRCLPQKIYLTACLTALLPSARAADAPQGPGPAPYPAEMNKKFTDPKADIQQFVQRFENEKRDVYAKRRDITRAVGLRSGDAIADIGAGTGLFTELFAEQVGPNGTVFAVDIGRVFLEHVATRARQSGHEQIVKTVLNKPDSVERDQRRRFRTSGPGGLSSDPRPFLRGISAGGIRL